MFQEVIVNIKSTSLFSEQSFQYKINVPNKWKKFYLRFDEFKEISGNFQLDSESVTEICLAIFSNERKYVKLDIESITGHLMAPKPIICIRKRRQKLANKIK